jgi:GNAT superfamily N-acetyltransferase
MTGELLQLSIEAPAASAPEKQILALLERANGDARYPRHERQFCATLRSSDGAVQGGIIARAFWGWLYIVAIAIEPAWRKQGYGRQLLAAAEAWGIEAACHDAWLMTMSFQARGFYEREGYSVFAGLADFPADQSRLFMRKSLAVTPEKT